MVDDDTQRRTENKAFWECYGQVWPQAQGQAARLVSSSMLQTILDACERSFSRIVQEALK